MKLEINDFGFRWGEVLVERTASNEKKPKFQLIRIFAPNGEIIEVLLRPRKNRVEIIPKAKQE